MLDFIYSCDGNDELARATFCRS